MVLLAIFIGLFLMAMVYPASKHLTNIVALFMLFVYAMVWHEGDLEVYRWVYQDLLTGQFYGNYEPGFVALMWICRRIGLPFVGFRLVLGSFITYSIYRIVRRQTDYAAMAMVLFSIFPFYLFASVLRSGIACVFVLRAIEQLISAKKDKRRFVGYILVATLFHYSSILFLPFLLFTGRVQKKKLLGVFTGMCAVAFIINYTDIMYNIVSRFTQREKILGWLRRGDATANLKGISGIAIVLIMAYLLNLYAIRKNVASSKAPLLFTGVRANQIQISYQLSVYTLYLSPLMVMASPFMRIPYMVLLVFIIASLNIAYGLQPRKYSSAMVIRISWVALLITVLVWKFYSELPYLKSGAHLFGEYLDAHFLW